MPGHVAHRPGLHRRPDLRRALPHEPRGARRRREPHRRRHLEPVGVDEALPDLGGQPRGVPLPGELADRVPAPQPHRDLPGLRAVGAPGRKHDRLPGDRGPELCRRPGRPGPPPRHRLVRRPGDREPLRGRPDPRGSPRLLHAHLRIRRVGGLGADPARHQGVAGRAGGLPGPRLPVLAQRQGVQRAAAAGPAGGAVERPRQPDHRALCHPRGLLLDLPQRRLGAGPDLEGQALRQAAARPEGGRRHPGHRGALHDQGAGARNRARHRRQPVGGYLPLRRLQRDRHLPCRDLRGPGRHLFRGGRPERSQRRGHRRRHHRRHDRHRAGRRLCVRPGGPDRRARRPRGVRRPLQRPRAQQPPCRRLRPA